MTEFLASRDDADTAIVDAYKEEFGRLEDNWKALETKGQGTTAVAGIFTAFALSFAKDIPAGANCITRALAIATVLLLALSIAFAASALFVRQLVSAPPASLLRQFADHLFAQSVEAQAEYRPALRKNLILAWESAATNRTEINDSKANRIKYAQLMLLAAIASAAVLAIITLLSPHPTSSPSQVRPETSYEVHQTWMYK